MITEAQLPESKETRVYTDEEMDVKFTLMDMLNAYAMGRHEGHFNKESDFAAFIKPYIKNCCNHEA